MRSPAARLEQVFYVHRTPEGDAAALQGLSLRVNDGEVVCVIGPSGAGKSTLLRVVAGIETPSAGEVLVLGREMGRLSARARARVRRDQIGFVGQNWRSMLSPELPLAEAVALPLMLRRDRARYARARALVLLEAAGLAGRENARAPELSGGERQRAAVCAALAHRPALLLADEPTGELDPRSATKVRQLIGDLARASGTSVIIVSHDVETADGADRTLRMRDGRIESELGGDGESRLIDPRGWVRLPREALGSAAIKDRVQVEAVEQGVLVKRVGSPTVRAPGSSDDEAPETVIAGDAEPDWAPARVELRAITRQHPDGASTRVVLDRFSLSFGPSGLTVVAGVSGAGKSTLLRLIAGLEKPDEGDVLIDGIAYASASTEELAALRRQRVGYLAQDPAPVGFLTSRENIVLALTVRGTPPGAATTHAQAALESVGLSERAGQRVSRLSAGEAQRVGLARALACARGLLILDEPTSRLDEMTAARVSQLLVAATRRGAQTVICATHDEQLISRADTVVSLAG